jgi:1-deoxy-D-xylulose-5-phosphate synthase
VVTLEEASLAGGFGSAVCEVACDAGLSAAHVHRLGIPDRYIEHAERAEQLADLGLDTAGIVQTCRRLAATDRVRPATARRVS